MLVILGLSLALLVGVRVASRRRPPNPNSGSRAAPGVPMCWPVCRSAPCQQVSRSTSVCAACDSSYACHPAGPSRHAAARASEAPGVELVGNLLRAAQSREAAVAQSIQDAGARLASARANLSRAAALLAVPPRQLPLASRRPPPPPAATPISVLPPNPAMYADASCHPMAHAGYSGGSLNWGLSFKVASAQECCTACRAHAATCIPGAGAVAYLNRTWHGRVVQEHCAKEMSSNELGTHAAQPCNVFVYCPTPLSEGGLCWSNDLWNHTSGECWLKHQPRPERPHAGAYGAYPSGYRKKHRTAPPLVQWMSGSLHTGPATVDGPHWHW